ncbi:hypothetical protein FDP41_001972 [Naegleria fowleri]|uniref:CNH domain-containing protein n=1 Tax=Naegleria fowleri TaxID=5763 RepID=A0A6A5BW96_NAEFO|nr:uncharacterized protein FDP41_001972 [Naegleria fowleri]KAF0978902.1 hypothetical protein FDP41_001972 [Naegleria fowleri]
MEVVPLSIQHSESQYGSIECSCIDNPNHLLFFATSEGYLSCYYINRNQENSSSSKSFSEDHNINAPSYDSEEQPSITVHHVCTVKPVACALSSLSNTSKRHTTMSTGQNVAVGQALWGKVPIKQIVCDDQVQVLFIQVQNAIEFFRYEFIEERKQLLLTHIKRIQESVGLTCFTIDECKRNHRLLVCTKKKLQILHYTEQDCLSVGLVSEEFVLPEAIQDHHCLAWFDKTLIVGFKKEYSLINMDTGTMDSKQSMIPSTVLELGDSKSGDNRPLCVLIYDEVLLRTDSISVFVNMNTRSSSEQRGTPSTRPPITWSSSPQQIAFSFPYAVGILDQGKKIEVYSIYDSRLVKTLYIQPSTNSVVYTSENGSQESNQLNNISSWSLVQGSVNIGVFVCCDSFVPASTTNTSSSTLGFKKESKKEKIQTVVLLSPISYEKQISSLFEMAHCSEAFELFERMLEFKREKGEHIDSAIEKRWRQQLLLEAAFASLFHLDVEKAFTYFREHEQALEYRLGYDMRELIILFTDYRPLILNDDNFSPKISWTQKYLNFEKKKPKSLYDIFVEKIAKRRDLQANAEVEKEADQLIVRCKKYLRPLLEYRRKKISSIERNMKDESLFFEEAFISTSAKSSIDNLLFKMYLDSGDLSRLNRMLKETKAVLKPDPDSEITFTAQQLYTKCYCKLDVCMKILKAEVEILSPEAQEYYMALLYQTYLNYNLENVNKSLVLLKNIAMNSDDNKSDMGEYAFDETVCILHKIFDRPMPSTDEDRLIDKKKELFWSNIEWCLKLDHFKSISVLTHNVSYLGVDVILKFVRQHLDEETQNEVIQLLLEYVIHDYNKNSKLQDHEKFPIQTQYYTLLALKYIDVINSYEIRQDQEAIWDLRTKLMLHIQDCKDFITLETVLARLQGTNLYQEMILLYSLSREHEKALRILLFDLCSMEGAENYCKEQQTIYELEFYQNLMQQYQDGALSSVEISTEMYDRHYTKVTLHNELFLILLKLCFQDAASIKQTKARGHIDFGIYILNKYAKHIDPIAALRMLPNNLCTKKILPFLTATLQQNATNLRTASLMKSMSKMDHIQTQGQLVEYQRRKRVVFRKSKCSFCNKFIGENACVVIYPDLCNIYHYNCFNRNFHVDRMSKRNFLKSPFILSHSFDKDSTHQ